MTDRLDEMKLLIFVLISLLALTLCQCGGGGDGSGEPQTASAPAAKKVVMVGDSLTYRADWSALMGIPISNVGIGGITSTELLPKIPTLIPKDSGKVFLMIGINNLVGWGQDPELVNADILKIVDSIKKTAPDAEVYLESVLPTSDPSVNIRVQELNTLLKMIKGVQFINLYPTLLEGETLNPDFDMGDGCHINYQGYQVWAAIIAVFIG